MPRRVFEGTVHKNSGNKTISVIVERRVKDPKYGKYMTVSKKFLAHDEESSCAVGDKVSIIESRPISKRKTWVVVENKTRGVS